MTPDCRDIRKDILRISHVSGHGHIPTCFSVVEMLYALYSSMKHDPADPTWNERDVFILSKGHAALAHYCVLASFGYFDVALVESFGGHMSTFGCHADRHKVPGVEVSTGSLGHGIGVASGAALALKIAGSQRRVFTLIGDGESNEGTVWEAIMAAANLRLSNLTVLYDNNMSHGRGLQITNPAERFRAFGCEVIEADGHDVSSLKGALSAAATLPKVIVANTVKGFGCTTLVNNTYEWHRRSPNEAEYRLLMGELNAEAV